MSDSALQTTLSVVGTVLGAEVNKSDDLSKQKTKDAIKTAFPTIASSPLIGSDDDEKKEVDAWLDQYDKELLPVLGGDTKKISVALHKHNKSLLSKVFLATNHLTIADLVLFGVVRPMISSMPQKERLIYGNITRWFDNIQHLSELKSFDIIQIDVDVPEVPAKQTKPVEAKKEEEKKEGDQKPKEEQKKGGEKKEGEQKPKEAKPKQEPKPKQAKPPAEKAPQLSASEDVSRLDIRVGKIVECKKHEGADSLYIEQIDVGEAAPRQVVSGLVKFIPLEQMQNRVILVLCNLKPSNLKGVKSHAMVLCASNADHTKVEFVEPPADAKIGERVTFEGYPGDAEKALKKETLDIVLPELKTDDACVAMFKGVPFTTSAGVCKAATISNGGVR